MLGYNKVMIYLEPIQISRHLCILHKDFTINCKVTLAPPKLDDVTVKKNQEKLALARLKGDKI